MICRTVASCEPRHHEASCRCADIPFRLLNAKPENVERESEIVSTSGRKNAVTIATNMAGRGTDIILGGNAEFMARYAGPTPQFQPSTPSTQDAGWHANRSLGASCPQH